MKTLILCPILIVSGLLSMTLNMFAQTISEPEPEPIELALLSAAQVPGTHSVRVVYDLQLPDSMETAYVWMEIVTIDYEYVWVEDLEGAIGEQGSGEGLEILWNVQNTFPDARGTVFIRLFAEGDGHGHGEELENDPISVNYDTRVFTVFVESYPWEGGQVTVTPSKDSYIWGEAVTVEAKAAADHRFAGWHGALESTEPVFTLTMDGDETDFFFVAYWEFRLAENFMQVWPSAVALGNGWQYVRWFDYFWAGDFFPWIFHEQHGWLFTHAARGSSIWFFDIDPMMGWWFTSDSLYPYLFRSWDESMLYFYAEGSAHGARWFYNYNYYPEPVGWELIGDSERTEP